jgi:hypothetical protein
VTAVLWNEEQSLVARAAYEAPFLVALTARRQLSALQVPLPKRLVGSPPGRASAEQARKEIEIAKIWFIFESDGGRKSCQMSQGHLHDLYMLENYELARCRECRQCSYNRSLPECGDTQTSS